MAYSRPGEDITTGIENYMTEKKTIQPRII